MKTRILRVGRKYYPQFNEKRMVLSFNPLPYTKMVDNWKTFSKVTSWDEPVIEEPWVFDTIEAARVFIADQLEAVEEEVVWTSDDQPKKISSKP